MNYHNYLEEDEDIENLLTREDKFSDSFQSFERDQVIRNGRKGRGSGVLLDRKLQNFRDNDEFENLIRGSRIAMKTLLVVLGLIAVIYSRRILKVKNIFKKFVGQKRFT